MLPGFFSSISILLISGCGFVSFLFSNFLSSFIYSTISSFAEIVAIELPSETLSPTFKFNFSILPEYMLGISTLDLSLSIVIKGSFFLILSPSFIKTSITSTSLKSPIFGTIKSLLLIKV